MSRLFLSPEWRTAYDKKVLGPLVLATRMTDAARVSSRAQRNRRGTPNVPAHFLYGEDWTAESLGFFHIEPFSVRNAPNDWRIGLHQHPDFHQVSISFRGACHFEHDGVAGTDRGPCCVITPAKVVHQFTYEPGSVGFVISMSPDFPVGASEADGPIRTALSRLLAKRFIHLNDGAVADRLSQLVSLISGSFETGLAENRNIIRYLFGALLLELDASSSGTIEREPAMRAPVTDLFERFMAAIEAQFDRADGKRCMEMSVEWFAAHLSTTPYLLNQACRRSAGRSTNEIIRTSLLGQATRLLLYTPCTIKEISYRLGYSHPSHFVRFFRRHRDATPEVFRQTYAERNPGKR